MICENNFTLTETIEILERCFSDDEVDNIIFTAIKDTSWSDENIAIIYIDNNKTFTIVKSSDDILETRYVKTRKFTWDNTCEDEEILKYGDSIMEIQANYEEIQKLAIQKFVEELSYKIGYKCDFSRKRSELIQIDVEKGGRDKALDALSDTEFINKYMPILERSKINNYDNRTN